MGFWDALSDLASAAGDVVEAVVDTVVDTVEDAVDTVEEAVETVVETVSDAACNTGVGLLCQAANIVGGVVIGIARSIKGIVGYAANIARGVGRIVSSLFRGNWAGAWNALLDVLVAVVALVVEIIRVVLLAPVAAGVFDLANRASLRRFIEERITALFGDNPNRVATLRSSIGLDGLHWGLNVPAHHHVTYMDSANTPIWQMHDQGILNLYELAGFSDNFHKSARTYLRGVNGLGQDEAFNISRSQIRLYLERRDSLGGLVDQLRVYSLTNRAAAKKMSVARKKCRKVGIELNWNDSTKFSVFNQYSRFEISPKPGDEDVEIHPYNFIRGGSSPANFLESSGFRNNLWEEECELYSTCAFHFQRDSRGDELLGVATGINIEQSRGIEILQERARNGNAASCMTPTDRDDLCFICIQTRRDGTPVGTGTFYRDAWPHWFSDYVPTHEIGHWLGLCHWGHTGFQKIMMTAKEGQGSGPWNWDIIWRTYAYGFEPHFTWKDARNVWRYILDQWAAPGRCL